MVASTLDAATRDWKRAETAWENKKTFQQFTSRKAGLPFMFRKWYR